MSLSLIPCAHTSVLPPLCYQLFERGLQIPSCRINSENLGDGAWGRALRGGESKAPSSSFLLALEWKAPVCLKGGRKKKKERDVHFKEGRTVAVVIHLFC